MGDVEVYTFVYKQHVTMFYKQLLNCIYIYSLYDAVKHKIEAKLQ